MTDTAGEIRLTTYIAVELLSRTTSKEIAEALIRGGKAAGTLFRRLEEVGTVNIAMRRFVRFRTDLADPAPVLRCLVDKGHGVAYPTSNGFEVQFPPRKGRVTTLEMLNGLDKLDGAITVYKGPKIKGWEAPFTDASGSSSI